MKKTSATQLNFIQVGDLGNEGNNSDVLKQLFWITPKSQSLQNLIDSLDTSIRVNLR